MIRKLLICPWFGKLPDWWPQYQAQFPIEGYEMLVDMDLPSFKWRVEDLLGIDCPITEGSSKIHDYRAAFGVLYADEITGYNFWGHTDFDIVYGYLPNFVTDEKLAACDIYSDCQYDYISGPFSLYKTDSEASLLFKKHPEWVSILEREQSTGWVETDFSDIAKENVRVLIENNHSFTRPDLLIKDGNRLFHDGREVSHHHFNRDHPKKWPL